MNWMIFAPELYALFMGAVFLGLSLTRPDAERDYRTAVALAAVGVGISIACVRMQGDLFYDTYRVDLYTQVFKTMLFMALFLVMFICSNLGGVEKRRHSEFYLLLSVCTLAMMMLVSSVHLLTIWVALELSSYSLYILVFLRKQGNRGAVTGLKYFLIGATASAIMLFGLALLYGATRATYIVDLMKVLPGIVDQPAVIIGLVLTLSGFLFKLAVFPFHFWAPDVYEDAPDQAAAYIATGSKVAAIAILMRMVALTDGSSTYLVHVLVTLSIASMTVGNLSAILQNDLKRLLAFSSIAQAGYILIGILSMSNAGYTGAIFYSLALLMMKFSCFMVVIVVAGDGRNIDVAHLAGLHRRSPILALLLMMALFGLAGIPPTIGFTGKLLIFTAAIEKGYLVLVLIAMANVVVSLYYYLLIVKAAYLTEPDEDLPDLSLSPFTRLLAGVLIAVIVVAGIYPTHLIELAASAARILG